MRLLKYIIGNGVLAAMLWLGTVEDIPGARNIAIFMAWFMFIVSLGMLSDRTVIKVAPKLINMPVLVWFDVVLDCVLLALMLWHGWWVTSVAFTMHCVLMAFGRNRAKELSEAKTPEEGTQC